MTNTPPTRGDSPLGMDVPPKRRQGLGGRPVYPARGEDCRYVADDLVGQSDSDGAESDDLPSCSPPQGMLATRLDGPMGLSMDISGSIYAVPEAEVVAGGSPSGGSPPESAGLGLCDSPPYEVRLCVLCWHCQCFASIYRFDCIH
jgi:hypothetical protein